MAFTSTAPDLQAIEAWWAEERAAWTPLDDPDSPEFWAMMQDVDDTMNGPVRCGVDHDLQADLRTAQGALRLATLDVPRTVQLFEGTLDGSVIALGRVRRQHDAALFSLLREIHERGLHSDVGLSMVDWLRHRVPGTSLSDATQLADVVRFAVSPEGVELGEAMQAGELALHRAAMVARTMRRLSSSLDPDQRERYTQIATGAAKNMELTDRELAMVCRKLIEDLLDESEPGERERKAQELRNVTKRKLANGLTRFSIDCPDKEAAAMDGVMTSALAAPQPTKDGPDGRSGGQRRFDALKTVLDRGLGNPGAPPSTARSSVIITIPFDPATGKPSGPGVTPTGEMVSAREAGQLACDGEITPVWLSPSGEPLRLGRTARFATPGQWKALVARDQHCTYPGCTMPPQWCDSHHTVYWCRDGDTDVDKMVLLCGRHHTLVHLRELVCEIVGGKVTWHV